MGIKVVEKDYELEPKERWAGLADVEENLDEIKDEHMAENEWMIVAFKMERTKNYGRIHTGFGRLKGSGYDWDLDAEIAHEPGLNLGHRFVIFLEEDHESSSSSSESDAYESWGIDLVGKDHELDSRQRWASAQDVEKNMDYIKRRLMRRKQWSIAAFKMERARKFERRHRGFGKLGGPGYNWDLDKDMAIAAVEDLGERFIVQKLEDSSSSSSSSDSDAYELSVKLVDKHYDLRHHEKWASCQDVEANMDYIQQKVMNKQEWGITAFKMDRTKRFERRRKGFGKLGGPGYNWNLDTCMPAEKVENLGHRFVRTRHVESDSSASSSDSDEAPELPRLKLVTKDYELEGREKWAAHEDVEAHMPYVKNTLMTEFGWTIAAFKMRRSRKFDRHRRGFGKMGGRGYGWDVDCDIGDDAAVNLGHRFVRVKADESESSGSSESE